VKRLFPVAGVFFLVMGLYWVFMTDEEAGDNPVKSGNREEDADAGRSPEEPPPALSLAEPDETTQKTDEEEPVARKPSLPRDAIPGERVLTFESEEAYLAGLKDLEAAGATILGRNRALYAVRVKGGLAEGRLSGGKEDYNFRVWTPQPVARENINPGALVPVGQNLRRTLGLVDGEIEFTRLGRGVRIAVLDTGIREHTALGEKPEVRRTFVEGRSGENATVYHGTAVAGLIRSNDAFAPGLAPGAELMDFQVLDGSGQGDSFSVANGIVAAVDAGADIVNLSLGSWGPSSVLESAVRYATEREVLLVAAVGNDGVEAVPYPAAYPDVLAVGSVDAGGATVPFSNQGSSVDLTAPGYQIHALGPENQFLMFNGTSASAPIVSSLAAWILAEDPGAPASVLREELTRLAFDQGDPGVDDVYGAGRVHGKTILERDNEDFRNLGVYSHLETSSGGQLLAELSVENRGNQMERGGNLRIERGGSASNYRIPPLRPEKTFSLQVPLSRGPLPDAGDLPLKAEIIPDGDEFDDVPEDDGLIIRLQPTE